MSEQLKPLCGVLDGVLERLSVIEGKLGICPGSSHSTASAVSSSAAAAPAIVEDEDVHPRLVAYDEHVKRTVVPFTEACAGLGPEMESVGKDIGAVWDGVRNIVELGTKYKKPADVPTALQPHLKPCQDAMAKIRSARIDRKFDWHLKAIMEMLACVSWVVMSPPPSPANFVKDTIGASDFWANKVRKEYKSNEKEGPAHVKFCDTMKAMVLDLSAYLKEHHLSGLGFNPHGKDFSDAKVGESSKSAAAATKPKAAPVPKTAAAAGGAAGIFAELTSKKTADGSSAATGLKKVTRDQQTWRKEYQKPGDDAPKPTAAVPKPAAASKFGAKKPLGPPKCEYQERGCKWNVENQTKETCEGGVCKVEVTDVKQQVCKLHDELILKKTIINTLYSFFELQVYIYKCENVTIQITGKCKSVILDSCTKCGVVFDNVISACEVVNCKRVQVQATGSCPSFSIDKTDGIVVHLSNEAVSESSFVTSKSSEMNVSWPDADGEIKEAPIPEQFMHKMVNGSVTSQVSDLYH